MKAQRGKLSKFSWVLYASLPASSLWITCDDHSVVRWLLLFVLIFTANSAYTAPIRIKDLVEFGVRGNDLIAMASW